MKRDTQALAQTEYDLLVVGGGIYGACVARDAALRGLAVALVEKGDFGSATSANSLKVIHGGLRYLQEGNIPLMRRMIAERAAWLRIAPHLVRPLPFAIPTYPHPLRHRLLLAAALKLNDLLGWDRNADLPAGQHIPDGRLLSRGEFEELAGWIDPAATGAAAWSDAQMINSDRLLLEIVQSAAEAGADVANYVEVERFLGRPGRIAGVRARDRAAGRTFDIGSRLVVNCAGGWNGRLLQEGTGVKMAAVRPLSVALNLVTRPLPLRCGLGLPSVPLDDGEEKGALYPLPRTFFLTPWGDQTLIGTMHLPWEGSPDDFVVSEEMVAAFIDGINRAYPPARLRPADVLQVHAGFLPLATPVRPGKEPALLREGEVRDHAAVDGVENLVTVTGVKYTTARMIAEQAVDLVLRKLDLPARPGETAYRLLPGAEGEIGVPSLTLSRLAATYGPAAATIFDLAAARPEWGGPLAPGGEILRAEVIHAVRGEMALTLADVVCRRLPLGAAGPPEQAALESAACLMGKELGWDERRQAREIAAVQAQYPLQQIAAVEGER